MNLTEEMLDAAIRKAIEAGLLPRHACHEDRRGHRELMRFILEGVLETGACVPSVQRQRFPVRERFFEAR